MKDDTISRQQFVDAFWKTEVEFRPSQIDEVMKILEQLPSAQPEHLCVVMDKISKAYEKAINTPCIHNPIAWALYQVWKEYDR